MRLQLAAAVRPYEPAVEGLEAELRVSVPSDVAFIEEAVELVAREDHVCARRASGRVACWGRILPGLASAETPAAPVMMP